MVLTIFHFIGFIVSVFAISVLAENSSIMIPPLRRGIISYIWALSFMALSFFWKLIAAFTPLPFYALADAVLLTIGILLIFYSTIRLFRSHTVTRRAV